MELNGLQCRLVPNIINIPEKKEIIQVWNDVCEKIMTMFIFGWSKFRIRPLKQNFCSVSKLKKVAFVNQSKCHNHHKAVQVKSSHMYVGPQRRINDERCVSSICFTFIQACYNSPESMDDGGRIKSFPGHVDCSSEKDKPLTSFKILNSFLKKLQYD